MNFLSLFVLIPILMMAGLAIARDMKQIRTVAVTFSTLQLGLAIYTAIKYMAERAAGNAGLPLFIPKSHPKSTHSDGFFLR